MYAVSSELEQSLETLNSYKELWKLTIRLNPTFATGWVRNSPLVEHRISPSLFSKSLAHTKLISTRKKK